MGDFKMYRTNKWGHITKMFDNALKTVKKRVSDRLNREKTTTKVKKGGNDV